MAAANDVGFRVVTQFYHDPATAHFVSHSPGGAGPGEGVENEIAGLGGELEHTLKKVLWFRCFE
jgi:hypothetical protein